MNAMAERSGNWAPASNRTASLDVIRNFFGEAEPIECERAVMSSSITRLNDFIDEERASLAGTAVESIDRAGESYTYPGGWAANLWHWDNLGQECLNLLLYYPRLVVHDPLAEFCFEHWDRFPTNKPIRIRNWAGGDGGSVIPLVGPGPHTVGEWNSLSTADPFRAKSKLAHIVRNILHLRELIDVGILRMVDQFTILLRYEHQLATSVRQELRSDTLTATLEELVEHGEPPLSWDNVRGMDVTPNWGKIVPQDRPLVHQGRLYYSAKCQVLAHELDAVYSPDFHSDLKLLEARVGSALPTNLSNAFIRDVSSQILPNFTLTPDAAVKMRLNEDDFEDWRSALMKLRLLTGDLAPDQVRELVQTELQPAIARVQRLQSRRNSFMRSWDQAAIPLVAELAVWKLGGAFGIGGVLAGALLWARAGLSTTTPGGADAVLATVVRPMSTVR